MDNFLQAVCAKIVQYDLSSHLLLEKMEKLNTENTLIEVMS